MHLAEALLPRDEAIRLAAEELTRILERNRTYYDRRPQLRPDSARPRLDLIRADDAWYVIPFERAEPGAAPLLVRVNGITRTVAVERSAPG